MFIIVFALFWRMSMENSMDYIYSPWDCKELDMTERFSLLLSVTFLTFYLPPFGLEFPS